jgi:TolB-like protein/DNA-binding SARP family transcriptional activator
LSPFSLHSLTFCSVPEKRFCLQLFGDPVLTGPAGVVTGRAVQRQRTALLALLAANRSGAVGRERLISCLWPDAGPARGRHLLSNSIYVLRQALGDDAILAAGDAVRLNLQRVQCDVREFVNALTAAEFQSAAEKYSGPFMDGFHLPGTPDFERWLEEERGRLAHLHAGALESVAEERERLGDYRGAAEWWRRRAAADPSCSRIALKLMQAMTAAGDLAAALQHARVHEMLLATEFELAPDPAVLAYADSLRSSRAALGRPGAPAAVPPPAAVASLVQDSTPAAASRSLAPLRPPIRRLALAAGAIVLMATVALLPARDRPVQHQQPPLRSIAVLPLADLSAGSEYEYFSDGITDELINTLARVEGLRVAARTSVYSLRGATMSVRDVARQLDVEHVLEGSVRRNGSQVRVSVQLIGAATGFPVWGATYDRPLDDIFSLQVEIARAISAALELRLGAPPLVATRTTSLEAYDLYLQGRYQWGYGSVADAASQDRALHFYRRAIERDPAYALAWAGLADAYSHANKVEQATAAAARAVALDSSLAEARTALAYVRAFFEWNWADAEQQLARALELDPAYTIAYLRRANLYAAVGRSDEAIADVERASAREPLSFLVSYNRGLVYYWAGRYDEAVRFLRLTLAMDTTRHDVRRELADAHFGRGDSAEAASLYLSVGDTVYAAIAAGSVPHLTRFMNSAPVGLSPVVRAKIAARLGDYDQAVTWLRVTVDARERWAPYHLRFPVFAPLHSDPRFHELQKRMGLAD